LLKKKRKEKKNERSENYIFKEGKKEYVGYEKSQISA
jgi:hypothetical protein